MDFNVVVPLRSRGGKPYGKAAHVLNRFGPVARSAFFGVCLSRALAVARTFHFDSPPPTSPTGRTSGARTLEQLRRGARCLRGGPEMDQKTAEMLNSLVQLEEDAVRACDQATTACDVMAIKSKVREMREQHAHRSAVLSRILIADGQHVVRRDEKGFLVEGFAPQMAGPEEVLAGLQRDEALVARSYGSVLAHELPAEVRAAIERAEQEEREHSAWIQGALADRAWERAA